MSSHTRPTFRQMLVFDFMRRSRRVLTAPEIAKGTKISERTVRHILRSFLQQGVVSWKADGTYKLTQGSNALLLEMRQAIKQFNRKPS